MSHRPAAARAARTERRWRLAVTGTIAAIVLGLIGFAVVLALTPRGGTPPAAASRPSRVSRSPCLW